MKNIIKLILALMLLPAVYFGFKELWQMAWHITVTFKIAIFFLAGAGVYALLHFFVYNFSRPYVAAHEFTHALAALFFGFKVKSVKIKKDSGAVKLSDYNEAVVLAPYVLPLYFIVFLAVCAVLVYKGYDGEVHRDIYSSILGFLFAFHIIHTVKTLTETRQPDLRMAGGRVFSIFCISFFNVMFLIVFLALIFPENVSVWGSVKDIFAATALWWKKVLNYIIYSSIEIFKL